MTSGHTTNVLEFLSNDEYDELCSSSGEFTFLCNQCTLHALPFADDSDCPFIITQGDDFLCEIADDTADQSTSERPLDFECLHSKGLNFIHLNTRRLDASVTDSEIDIADYTIKRRDRNREGGGVCIYIRRFFIFKLRDDICTTLETVWAELYLSKIKPISIGVCYRPPKHMDFFLIHLNNVAWTVIVLQTKKLL